MKKLLVILIILNSYLLIPIPTYADVTKTQNTTVSALVGPQASAFQFSFAEQNNETTIHQGEYHTYVVTYGANQSAAFPTDDVITISFANDLAPNNQHMFDYVDGSASEGYGGAKPIVDLINRTVTWHIDALPPGTTDQKVFFNLFTNSYQTTGSFDIALTATMNNDYVTMPEQLLTQHYRYRTPTPGPTATPGPAPTATPTPPPPPPPLYSAGISSITQNSAHINITTTYPSKISISYGTSPTDLSRTISSNDITQQNSLTLSDLDPDTKYYFKAKITSKWGYATTSEIYTFTTAMQSSSVIPFTGTTVISANGAVLLSEAFDQSMTPGFALLTASFPYDVTVSLPQGATYQSVESLVQQQLPINTLEMSQQQSNIYDAHMPTLNPGIYSLSIKTLDATGNLTLQQIADLKIIPPLSVNDAQSNTPLENARVFLWYFDQGSNSYKAINAGMFGMASNPGYTDANGIYAVNLPPGRYRAEASALFYDTATVDFTLGKNDDETFPRIALKKDPTNLTALLTVIKDYLIDSLTSTFIALQTIATSSRVFHIVATTSTASLVLLSYLLFLLKSHTSLKNLPLLFFLFIDVALQKHKGKYLFGKVTDRQGLSLSLVRVEVEDANSKTILRHTTTNKNGKFYFLNKFTGPVNLIFVKEGFHPTSHALSSGFPEQGLKIVLETGEPHHLSAFALLGRGLRDILGMLFETALVLSIILELLFFFFYGFARTAPFLVLSIINIILWLFYIHQRSDKTLI